MKRAMRELSSVITPTMAARVLEILRRNLRELGEKQVEMDAEYVALGGRKTKREIENYMKRSKALNESVMRMSGFIEMFEEIRWSQDSLQPAFYRRMLNGAAELRKTFTHTRND